LYRRDLPQNARMRSRIAFAAALCTLSAHADEGDPAVVPYRPSVATSAELPAPGWPELEAGFAWAKDGGMQSRSTPLLFKLAWSESWAMLVGTDAYDWQRDEDGAVAHGGGNTTLALKYRLPASEHVTLGAQLGASLPTARAPIGSGHADWALTTIASLDYPAIHVDLNAAGVRLGTADEGRSRWQGAWAVAASHPLDERFGVTGEVSGVAQHGTAALTQGLVALSYNVSRALVLDVAFAAGWSRGAPDRQVMTGMTLQLGRWF
jgi:hypothetical protein